ncbi:hypothetical protein M5689_016495 [Euphorbia peplus]|nr:hypothetical protein M5689_016495 [Euphorbia peplus]
MAEDESLNDFLLDSTSFAATTEPSRSIPVTGKILLGVEIVLTIILLITASIWINSYVKAFHTPTVEVDSVTVYPFNVSSNRLTANWSITMSIENSEFGTSYNYKDVEVSILLKDEVICSKKIIGELNVMKKKTVRIENVEADMVDVKKSIVDALRLEWRRDGALTFSVKIKARANKALVDNNWRTMHVNCANLRVAFISNTGVATLIDPSIICSSYL